MSTESIRDLVNGETPLFSWETWDRIKHTEWFSFLAAVIFVALFAWLFARAPVTGDLFGGFQSLARTILVWAIFALGFNLLLGQTGLLSFGHALFFGGSAYTAGAFAVWVYPDPILVLMAGVGFALAAGFATAFIVLRMHTVYFAIMTLAIAQLGFYLAIQPLRPITGGENGLRFTLEPLFGVISLREKMPGILGSLWGDYLYLFIGFFFIATVVFIVRLRKSPYGLIYRALRENERRTAFVGLDVWRYKFSAYLFSVGIAGLAGGLGAINSLFAGLGGVNWMTSGEVVVIAILGGMGTIVGPILGAIVFLYFEGIVTGWAVIGRYWLLMLAIAFTAIVWRYPTGIWGMFQAITARVRSRGGDSG